MALTIIKRMQLVSGCFLTMTFVQNLDTQAPFSRIPHKADAFFWDKDVFIHLAGPHPFVNPSIRLFTHTFPFCAVCTCATDEKNDRWSIFSSSQVLIQQAVNGANTQSGIDWFRIKWGGEVKARICLGQHVWREVGLGSGTRIRCQYLAVSSSLSVNMSIQWAPTARGVSRSRAQRPHPHSPLRLDGPLLDLRRVGRRIPIPRFPALAVLDCRPKITVRDEWRSWSLPTEKVKRRQVFSVCKGITFCYSGGFPASYCHCQSLRKRGADLNSKVIFLPQDNLRTLAARLTTFEVRQVIQDLNHTLSPTSTIQCRRRYLG